MSGSAGPWEVEVSRGTDADGWAHAVDWGGFSQPPPPAAASRKLCDFVRRRRWRRRRRRVRDEEVGGDGGGMQRADSVAAAAAAALRGEAGTPRVLGVVQPGACLPLPYGWRTCGAPAMSCSVRWCGVAEYGDGAVGQGGALLHSAGHDAEVLCCFGGASLRAHVVISPMHCLQATEACCARAGKQLVVRPLPEEGKAPAHAWSLGASNGEHALRLDGLAEGATRLLACPALHPAPPPGADAPSAAEAAAAARSGSGDAASALAAATVWLRFLGFRV